jgi:hypothetical protein
MDFNCGTLHKKVFRSHFYYNMLIMILNHFRGRPAHVVCGTNNLKDGLWYNVAVLISHPLYDPETNENDIGMIKIKTNMEFSDKVQPIKLPDERAPDNALYTTSGWGKTKVIIPRSVLIVD